MERRAFIEKSLMALALTGLFLLTGCGKREKPAGFGNQEKLWKLTTAESKIAEPIDLAYVKDTPALYRDASMGKADPSFVPKVSGG